MRLPLPRGGSLALPALSLGLPGALTGSFARYVARRFLAAILGVYFACAALIYLVEFVENLRRASSAENVSFLTLVQLGLYRTPAIAEQALPFAVLLGSIAALLNLSRRNELAVVRATGVSVWQFLAPGLAAAFVLGVVAVAVYNPGAAHLRDAHQRLEVAAFRDAGEPLLHAGQSGLWLQQEGIDGKSVMRAGRSLEGGTLLTDVSVYVYDSEGKFVERIEAAEARLMADHWALKQAWVTSAESEPQLYDSYLVSTFLTSEQVARTVTDPKSVSVWELPEFIDHARRAGLNTTPYIYQWHALLSRPLAFVAMVLIAATVSLRLFRFGNIGRMVLTGIAAGFAFFFVTKVAGDFGSAGLLGPAAAAWLPVIIVMLAGLTILLYQEDG